MDRDYLVWSNEHGAWWGPGRHGYRKRLSEAGRYTQAEALEISAQAISGDAERMGLLPELSVRLADVQAMQKAFHRTFNVPPGSWE